jgi:MerR family transcriptional regulator, light-induced transcriptional regulator
MPNRERSGRLRLQHVKTDSWAATADEVASAIAELGRQWEAASCLVFEEHIATEALRRAAASCASEMPCARNAPRVVVFTVEGERHTLGLSLEDLVLVEAGWRVVWVGEGPPLAELNPLIPKLKPDLLNVSASTWSSQSVIARYQAELMRVTSRHRIPVVLGGAGLWAAARGAHRIITFGELHSFLVRMQWRARTK